MGQKSGSVFTPTRRAALQGAAGLLGGALLPFGALRTANAADAMPAIGTYPAGTAGDTVFIGITVPRTGTYAVPGEDELKGAQLAIAHLNAGDPVVRMVSPLTTKGVLGKRVVSGVADSAAKPNEAVQNGARFIAENKASVLIGCVSSAEAVALNKLGQREHVIYLAGISGSNDTTGKDCTRYGFRECFYGQTAAAALAPVIVKNLGKNKKVAYLTPDYTYGHTVNESMEQYLKADGWTTVTNQVCPLGAPDYSSFLLNIANSGADVFININFGNDAVQSIKQAQQFGILKKQTLVVPYNTPFLARDVGADLMAGVYAATDFWWTLQDRFPVAKAFVAAFDKQYGYKPEWGAQAAYLQIAFWADAVERAKTFYPPAIIAAYEAGVTRDSTVGPVHFRAEDHQLVRPVVIVRGKGKAAMTAADDYYDVLDVVPGAGLMQAPGAFGCHLGPAT